MTLTGRRLAAAAVSAGALWLAASASGQCCIPEAEIASATPDTARIAQCIQTHKDGLSGEFAAIKKSRRELLCPLLGARTVSVRFRTEYSDQLVPVLRPLMAAANDETALNAVRIAGELGTPAAAAAVAAALTDKRPSVRLMAADALGRTFAVAATPPVALTGQEAAASLGHINRAIDAEKDPFVLDGLVMALDSAMKVPGTAVAGLRTESMRIAAVALGARARAAAADPAFEGTFIRATTALQGSLSQVGPGMDPAPPATLKEIGGLAGDALAYALRRVEKRDLDAASRASLSVLVTQAENLYILVAQRLGAAAPRSLNLGQLVADGADDRFRRDVVLIIGAGGGLTAPPFGLPADRFIPQR